jgi:hypothetical protein
MIKPGSKRKGEMKEYYSDCSDDTELETEKEEKIF